MSLTVINKIGKYLSRKARKLFSKQAGKIGNFRFYSDCLKGKIGLELGGPSEIFKKRGILPVYAVVSKVDGCNFSETTIWEGRIEEGPGRYIYQERKAPGHQYVKDAVDLGGIDDGKYDFILSSHAIEHIADPLRAVSEWLRVLKTDGFLLLVAPHRDGTFDHRRPITTLQHLIDDFTRSVSEDDSSHLQEILELHDLSMDPPAGDHASFMRRSLKNIENRCLHHHVFDARLLAGLMQHCRLQILDIQLAAPHHIIALAQKVSPDRTPENSVFLRKAEGLRLFARPPKRMSATVAFTFSL